MGLLSYSGRAFTQTEQVLNLSLMANSYEPININEADSHQAFSINYQENVRGLILLKLRSVYDLRLTRRLKLFPFLLSLLHW